MIDRTRTAISYPSQDFVLKKLLITLTIAALLTVAVISFLPGFRPDQLGFSDESDNTIGPLSYFKTPQSAVLTTSRLLEENDWTKLSQFYDQQSGKIDYETLLDGTYFRIDSEDRSDIRPFPPEYRYFETLKTDFEDTYRIIVRKPVIGGKSDETASILLKHYPEGYRILPEQPSPPASETGQ